MRVIILYGLRRSGNHFLISLILQNYTNHVHINDINNMTYDNYLKYSNINVSQRYSDNHWIGFKGVDCVVLSVENQVIDPIQLETFRTIPDISIVVLLRCPSSHFSSVWKVYNKGIDRLCEIVRLWDVYADYLLSLHDVTIKVVYDELVTNDVYRNKRLKEIINKHPILDQSQKMIKYQHSSFANRKQQCMVYTDFTTCIFKDDLRFMSLIDHTAVHSKWLLVLKKMNLYHNDYH